MSSLFSGFRYQSRHTIRDAIPAKLGSISLGYSYSDRQLKVYWTKSVGQKGVIDVNLSTFIEMWRTAISNTQFSPELLNFFQNLSNELMPGFECDIASFNWFLRPHAHHRKIGFALMGTYLQQNILEKVTKLRDLSSNWSEYHPNIGTFGIRRKQWRLPNIGDISSSLFIAFSSSTRCMIVISCKFLFNPFAMNSKTIHSLSKKNMSINRLDASEAINNKNNVNNLENGMLHCQYRTQFICLWIMFVSSILFKTFGINFLLQKSSKL